MKTLLLKRFPAKKDFIINLSNANLGTLVKDSSLSNTWNNYKINFIDI